MCTLVTDELFRLRKKKQIKEEKKKKEKEKPTYVLTVFPL